MNFNQNNIYGNNNINFGAQPRRLDDTLKSQLRTQFTKSEKIKMEVAMNDGEAASFGDEISGYLQSQGFTVEGTSYCMWAPPLRGQFIDPNPDPEGCRIIRIGHQQLAG